MGIQLVGAAMQPYWAGLSDKARLCLLRMCYIAKDSERLYWGGHDVLMIDVLGRTAAMSATERASSQRMIRKYIKELTAAGAIKPVVAAGGGRRAYYELTPGNFTPMPVDNSAVDNSRGDEEEDSQSPALEDSQSPAPGGGGGLPESCIGGLPESCSLYKEEEKLRIEEKQEQGRSNQLNHLPTSSSVGPVDNFGGGDE